MSRAKKTVSHAPRTAVVASKSFVVRPTAFVFFDKKSGSRRFDVKAGDDGHMPAEQAASLLAIHCVARQQQPRDFDVMVAAGDDLVDGIVGRANKLIRSCSGFKVAGMPLSRRQHEVLAAISQNLSNKEIAAKLNVSVRTVKFHVSTLLEKFEVRGRVDLMLEAADFLPLEGVHKRVHGNAALATASGAAAGPSASMLSLDAPPRLRITDSLDRRAGG